MNINKVKTYGKGLDITYEKTNKQLSTDSCKLKSDEEYAPELTEAWKKVTQHINDKYKDIKSDDAVIRIYCFEFKWVKEELGAGGYLRSINFYGVLDGKKALRIEKKELMYSGFEEDEQIDIIALIDRIEGYVNGERAQDKFDFSLKDMDNTEDNE